MSDFDALLHTVGFMGGMFVGYWTVRLIQGWIAWRKANAAVAASKAAAQKLIDSE